MSRYMDNNTESADSRSNSTKMNVENPYQYNYVDSPQVAAPALAGGTSPNGASHSEISYMDDNSAPVSDNGADSRAKNRNTIVEVSPADATPNEAKNYSVDDFLTHGYIPSDVTNNVTPNMQGLYGKGGK